MSAVGKHFAQPLKPYDSEGRPKQHIVRQALRDRSMNVLDSFEAWINRFSVLERGRRQHRAVRSDFRDVLSDETIEFDAVYADPPYTRDHYSRYYHVLETMSLRDNPEVSMTMIRAGDSPRVSRGIYRADRYQSPFCIKSQALELLKIYAEASQIDEYHSSSRTPRTSLIPKTGRAFSLLTNCFDRITLLPEGGVLSRIRRCTQQVQFEQEECSGQ